MSKERCTRTWNPAQSPAASRAPAEEPGENLRTGKRPLAEIQGREGEVEMAPAWKMGRVGDGMADAAGAGGSSCGPEEGSEPVGGDTDSELSSCAGGVDGPPSPGLCDRPRPGRALRRRVLRRIRMGHHCGEELDPEDAVFSAREVSELVAEVRRDAEDKTEQRLEEHMAQCLAEQDAMWRRLCTDHVHRQMVSRGDATYIQ